MSIHYKFRSSIERKTLQFDALTIRADDLVTRICKAEKIREDLFTLLLSNEFTAEKYTDDMQIARNSSIIVQRAPREKSAKVQKVQSGVNSGAIVEEPSTSSLSPSQMSPINYENMDENERLDYIKKMSTKTYDPSNYKKITKTSKSSAPPLSYICNRCYQPGHWIKDCSMANIRKTTGIPMAELVETTSDDPQAMLHPTGKYVVRKMHKMARETKTKKIEDDSKSDIRPPSSLICKLCENLIKEAVITSCCGISFCDQCINEKLLQIDEENIKCPGKHCKNRSLTLESVVPNKNVRKNVEQWLLGRPIETCQIPTTPAPATVQFDPTQPPPGFEVQQIVYQAPIMNYGIQPVYYSQPPQFDWEEYLRNRPQYQPTFHHPHHRYRDRKDRKRVEEKRRHGQKSSRSHHKSSRDEPYRRRC